MPSSATLAQHENRIGQHTVFAGVLWHLGVITYTKTLEIKGLTTMGKLTLENRRLTTMGKLSLHDVYIVYTVHFSVSVS